MQAIMQSSSDGLGAILAALPALIGAIILVIGFIVAKVLQGVVTKLLERMGFDISYRKRGGETLEKGEW